MNTLRGEALRGKQQADTTRLAEQLVDNPWQMQVYDQAKWNLLGHADRRARFEGHHPWLKHRDSRGIVRTMSVPVFSGYSPETETVMAVRKDPWTELNDPESWLVAEQKLTTGDYVEPKILSAYVDRANRLSLHLAPGNYDNWPPCMHPALFARPYDQIRIIGQLDASYHMRGAEYRDGRRAPAIEYADIEALESMIITVQQQRWKMAERAFQEARARATAEELGFRGLALLDSLERAS